MFRLLSLLPLVLTLSLFCSLWLSFATAAAAQDRCQAVVDLKRIFVALTGHAASATAPDRAEAQTLLTSEHRYDRASLDYIFDRSPLSSQTPLVLDAYATAMAITQSLTQDAPDASGLRDQEALREMNRALAVLARLNCPPVPNEGTVEGYETGLLRVDPSKGTPTALSIESWLAILVIGGIVLSLVLGVGMLIHRRRTRASARSKRYLCEIIMHYIAPGPVPTLASANVVDISREGAKLGLLTGPAPLVGSLLTIQIGGGEKRLRVKWKNTHFFGGLFATPYTRQQMIELLRSDANRLRRKESDPSGPPAPSPHEQSPAI